MKEVFRVEKINDSLYVLHEHIVRCILILGTEKALLLDTGFGWVNLPEEIRKITKLPLMVVNGHWHPDHNAGNRWFDTIYANPAEFNSIAMANSKEYPRRAAYNAEIEFGDMIYKHLDFKNNQSENEYNYNYKFMPLWDGEVIDLGGRKIRAIHAPGHSSGSLVLYDETNKILFGNDTTLEGPCPYTYFDSNLTAYRCTLERLKKLDFDVMYSGHGKLVLEKSYLDDLIELVTLLLDKKIEASQDITLLYGMKAKVYRHKRVSITYDYTGKTRLQ